jgi:hypothetical protein
VPLHSTPDSAPPPSTPARHHTARYCDRLFQWYLFFPTLPPFILAFCDSALSNSFPMLVYCPWLLQGETLTWYPFDWLHHILWKLRCDCVLMKSNGLVRRTWVS